MPSTGFEGGADARHIQAMLGHVRLETTEIVDLAPVDWARIAGLLDTYTDIGLDAADASIIAIAERLNQTTIATLDGRDFRIVRPAHIDAFGLLPGPA